MNATVTVHFKDQNRGQLAKLVISEVSSIQSEERDFIKFCQKDDSSVRISSSDILYYEVADERVKS